MENLPVRGAPRRRTIREKSPHKTAPPPRHRGCTKGKSCSWLASSSPFFLVMSSRMPATSVGRHFASPRQSPHFLYRFGSHGSTSHLVRPDRHQSASASASFPLLTLKAYSVRFSYHPRSYTMSREESQRTIIDCIKRVR